MANQTVTVEQGQCLVDIAVQHCGDADMLIELALLNGLDIDDVAEGSDLVLPPLSIEGSEIAAYLAVKGIVPASAIDVTTAFVDEWEAYYDNGEDDWDVYFGFTG